LQRDRCVSRNYLHLSGFVEKLRSLALHRLALLRRALRYHQMLCSCFQNPRALFPLGSLRIGIRSSEAMRFSRA